MSALINIGIQKTRYQLFWFKYLILLITDLRTPTEFTAKQFGPNVLFLLWCKASGPVTGYRVECFKDDSQSAEFIKDVPNVSQESLIIIGLQRNHTYRLGIASRTAEATNQPVFIEHRITDSKNVYSII